MQDIWGEFRVISMKLRVPATFGVAAALALTAAGCSSGGGSSTATGNITLTKVSGLEKTTLNVGAVPAMDSAGFFIALREGLFADEGLTIKYTPETSSDTAIQGQVNGQLDITAGNYVSYIQAQAEGLDGVRSVGGLEIVSEGSVMEQGSQVILTLPKDHINSLKDLEGKTVAVNAPQNIDELLLDSTLTDAGIPVDSVHIADDPVTGVPFPFMSAALEQGSFNFSSIGAPGGTKPVDAVVVPEPFASTIETVDGGLTVADMNQGATTEFPIEGYVVTKKWAQQNPNTLQAFLNALEEGQQIADTDRAAVEQAFESLPNPQSGQVSGGIASMMALNTYPVSIDPTRLQRVVDVMLQFNALPRTDKNFQISEMLSPSS
jgi:NitT/TauT family transport system substrate-binding protein